MGISIWDGIGAVASKITQFIKGPVEAAKNEQARLLNERDQLMDQPQSDANTRRVANINAKLYEISIKINNAAKDS